MTNVNFASVTTLWGETHLLPGFQLIPPLLHQLVVLLIQVFQPLSLVLDQQVTFLILGHETSVCYWLWAFFLLCLSVALFKQNQESPGAASDLWCYFHTDRSSPSSGFHVSAADAASPTSAASPPAEKTRARQRQWVTVSLTLHFRRDKPFFLPAWPSLCPLRSCPWSWCAGSSWTWPCGSWLRCVGSWEVGSSPAAAGLWGSQSFSGCSTASAPAPVDTENQSRWTKCWTADIWLGLEMIQWGWMID